MSVERTKSTGPAAGPKKQCNCKNSRCLKLYCECFASGRYCDGCNCIQCYNNRENESTRQSAVEAILERNPNAFRPKIQAHEQAAAAAAAVAAQTAPGRHLKGCNCKKSFCLKKYCECFQAGIYCSENCKCVDCKNYEEPPVPGFAGGPKRARYSSAPPPQLGMGQPFGLPPQGPGFPGGMVPTIRPGGFGGLPQQPGIPVGMGMSPGMSGPGMGPLMAGGPGGPRPTGGGMASGLGGLGGSSGALATLPQALSLALASAGNGQPGAPLIAAPSPAVPAQNGQAALRSGLFEVVNGMVKRPVIEELCSLLWLVADDEAARARGGSGGGGGASTANSGVPTRASADGGGQQQQQQGQAAAAVAEAGAAVGLGAGGLASTGVDGAAGRGRDGEAAGAAPMDAEGAPRAPGSSCHASDPSHANGNGGSGGAGVGREGVRQPQLQPPRPGPLYGRRERVVLEEFLSIINKIGDTAAKKLPPAPPQAAAPAAAPLQYQPPLLQPQPQQPQHMQLQFPQQQALPQQPVLLAALSAHGQAHPQAQPYMQPPLGQPQSGVVLAAATGSNAPPVLLAPQAAPSPGQPAGFAAGPAPSQPPLVRPPGVPVGHTATINGQAGPSLLSASGQPSPQFPGAGSASVPIIRPPLPPGHSAAGAGSAHPHPAGPQPHPQLHGNVPVILAPPRGGHGIAGPSGQQLQHQPHMLAPPAAQLQHTLHVGLYPNDQQQSASGGFTSPFVPPFGTVAPTHGSAADPQAAQGAVPDAVPQQQGYGLQQLLAEGEPEQQDLLSASAGMGGGDPAQAQAAAAVMPLQAFAGGGDGMGYVDGVGRDLGS